MATNPEIPLVITPFPPSGTQSLPTRRIRVLGVPLDMGASRRGVDMGPSAMRVAGLEARLEALGHHVSDSGNVTVDIAETQNVGNPNARYLKQIADTCTRTSAAVLKTLEEGMTPLRSGRRPLHCGGVGLRRFGVLSAAEPEDRRDLDRCPLRHQHARNLAQRQRSRHAVGGAAWSGT